MIRLNIAIVAANRRQTQTALRYSSAIDGHAISQRRHTAEG